MQANQRNFGQLFGGIALGFAVGASIGYGAQPAVASGTEAGSPYSVLSEQIAQNSRRITELERQLRGVDNRIGTIDRKVESNRDATRVLATRSGIQMEFRD